MRIELTDVAIHYTQGNGPAEIIRKVNDEEVRDGVLTLRHIDANERRNHLGSWPLTALRKWHRIGSTA